MIIVTGAAGFIGSCLIQKLNEHNFNQIIAVDHFHDQDKLKNLENKTVAEKVDRNEFFAWLDNNNRHVEFIFHLGARTDTYERDQELLNELNTEYTKQVWEKCIAYQIPLIYASSAATYGLGTEGYLDDESSLSNLQPLNAYGHSKHNFDLWATAQEITPMYWCGLKFFNVYGPNEYHKDRMASVIFHAYHQIGETGSMKLFRSHHPDFRDGEQKRDFVYVKDVVDVMYWLMHHRKDNGIYNLGCGKAETFKDLCLNVFKAMDLTADISFIDTPEAIRATYQYFTEANIAKLRAIGYSKPFHSLEEGILDYVMNYLAQSVHY